jgi:hypothetical protein
MAGIARRLHHDALYGKPGRQAPSRNLPGQEGEQTFLEDSEKVHGRQISNETRG